MILHPLRISSLASHILYLFVCIFLGWTIVSTPTWAAPVSDQDLAGYLLKQTGVHAGIAVIPRAGNGSIALALTKNSSLKIYAMDANNTHCNALRSAADAAGVLGQLLVQNHRDRTLPFPNHYVDLVLVLDATDDGLGDLLASELVRIIAPYNGYLVVGKCPGSPGSLTESALQRWGHEAGLTGANIQSGANGLYLFYRKPALEGSDNWTHISYDSGGNWASKDTALTLPMQFQWLAKPYLMSTDETHLCSFGRYYTATNGEFRRHGFDSEVNRTLIARSAYNGQVLWTSPLSDSMGFRNSSVIAMQDAVYLIYGAKVRILDARSGALKRDIALASEGCRGWAMVLDGDVLYFLAGEGGPDLTQSKALRQGFAWEGLDLFLKQFKRARSTEIIAYDVVKQTELWRQQVPKKVESDTFTAKDGRVVYFEVGSEEVVARSGQTGVELWRCDVSSATYSDHEDHTFFRNNITNIGSGLQGAGIYLLNSGFFKKLAAVSLKSGELLWAKYSGMDKCFFHGNRLFKSSNDYLYEIVDPLTGKLLVQTGGSTALPETGGCGRSTASGNYCFDMMGCAFDLNTMRKVYTSSHENLPTSINKSGCGSATFVANGLYFKTPTSCVCRRLIFGTIAYGSAPDIPLNQPVSELKNLEMGTNGLKPHALLPTDALDWTTYRADNMGSAAVDVDVSGSASPLWERVPPQPYPVSQPLPQYHYRWTETLATERIITPPVTAGGYVYYGDTEGRIYCLNVVDGREVWKTYADGPVVAAPTLGAGRVYVGALDGRVYCLDAITGRLLWRFRVGPADQRIMIYGHLGSRWPIYSSPLVWGNKVYVKAGLQDRFGTSVMALDAATGQILWQRPDVGHYFKDAGRGVSGTGRMVVAGDRLWINQLTGPLASFDLHTGEVYLHAGKFTGYGWRDVPGEKERGKEIVAVDGQYLLIGCAESSLRDQVNMEARETFAVKLNDKGDSAAKKSFQAYDTFVGNSFAAPAWNRSVMVWAKPMDCWNLQKGLTALNQLTSSSQSNKGRGTVARRWTRKLEANALALGKNAVVATYRQRQPNEHRHWFLEAWDLESGASLWKISLKDKAPVYSGLALDRRGNVLVSFCDGTVTCYGDPTESYTNAPELLAHDSGPGEGNSFRRLALSEYLDKMKAGWIGQMAGVGWGAPTEFRWNARIIPEEEVPRWEPGKINQFNQDDIYVEMTFLRTLELYGLNASIRQAGIDFANSGYMLWHANSAGRTMLREGIAPPDSGHPKFNRHADDIDYQIEADYSGLIAPGMPNMAVRLGETFGRLMNYGDGVYGGQFVGAMYAEAFFEDDVEVIVRKALAHIPKGSQYHECISDVLKWHAEYPDDWKKAWKLIDAKYQKNPAYRRFSCGDPKGDHNIDAKINGAYIVMGLLYGERDPDKTIILSMRCGLDSDCNPSNAAGVLFTTMGMEEIPARFKSDLDTNEVFSHTSYDFAKLVRVCQSLARQAVEDAGGRIEGDTFVIPVEKPRPSKLEKSHEPGPIAGSRFTEVEMAKIEYPTMQGAVDQVIPGWTVSDWGLDWSPGLWHELEGKENVFVAINKAGKPYCRLSRTIAINGGTSKMKMTVGRVPWFFCRVLVEADGKELAIVDLNNETMEGAWREVEVDLSAYRGKTIELEILSAGPTFIHSIDFTR